MNIDDDVEKIMLMREYFKCYFLSLSLSQDGSSADSLREAINKVNSHNDLSAFCIAYMKYNASL